MTDVWVLDASPLILLGKIGQATLPTRLAEVVVVPDGVVREVGAREDGRETLARLRETPNVQFPGPVPMPANVSVWDLGPGESDVMAHCCAYGGSCRAAVDDLRARQCAAAFGIPVVGTVGIVLRAKGKGEVAAARPLIDALLDSGLYVADDLVRYALNLVGE